MCINDDIHTNCLKLQENDFLLESLDAHTMNFVY